MTQGNSEAAVVSGAGARPLVLCVEDELVIAMMVQDFLDELGYDVVIAQTADEGCRFAAESRLSAGILDVHLGRETSFPVARALQQRCVPFLFTSGAHTLDPEFKDIVCVAKPYSLDVLEARFNDLFKPTLAA